MSMCTRWLIALALVTSLGGGIGCTGSGPISDEFATPDENAEQPAIVFTDVTAQAGLGGFRHEMGSSGEKWFPEQFGAGAAFIDYNGDGRLDILLVGGAAWEDNDDHPALWLYRNDGDGTFTLQTEEAGLGGVRAFGFGVVVADYNNNGLQDFYLTALHENKLFRNDGGTFTDVTGEAGVGGDPSEWSTAAVFFDADRDGHLDLFVGNYTYWSPEDDLFCSLTGTKKSYCSPELYGGIPGRFFRNNGDGTFTDATVEAGFGVGPGKTLGVAEFDYDRDGWPDLVVANDLERDLLFRNNGDGTFTEMGVEAGVAYDEHGRARAGMGIDTGVVDDTGEETIFVSNFSNEMVGIYRHIRDGIFSDRAAVSRIGGPTLLTLGFGLFLFDIDYDGHLDFFLVNGHVQPDVEEIHSVVTYKQRPQLFLNRGGNGTFEEFVAAYGVLTTPLAARGAAYGDIDHSGRPHLLITENGGPVHLWRNDSEMGNHLRVHLQGVESNRDGVGSRVVAVVDGRRMERRVRTASTYLSQSEKTVTFGLAGAPQVDTLTIFWPSGHVDRFEDIRANQTLHIVEGTMAPDSIPVAATSHAIPRE
jgi:enediyne biosynthesis protein E4